MFEIAKRSFAGVHSESDKKKYIQEFLYLVIAFDYV